MNNFHFIPHTGTVKDKIFVAVGSDVRGYTKKGKLFLDFGTNLTESIESMSISGSHLLTCGNHVYNQYMDCRDTNYFLSEDVITDVLALPGEKVSQVLQIYRFWVKGPLLNCGVFECWRLALISVTYGLVFVKYGGHGTFLTRGACYFEWVSRLGI